MKMLDDKIMAGPAKGDGQKGEKMIKLYSLDNT